MAKLTPAQQYSAQAKAANRRYAYHYAVNRCSWTPGRFVFDSETMDDRHSEAALRSLANVTRIVIGRLMVKR